MGTTRAVSCLSAILAGSLLLAGTAAAAPVTIGSPLTAAFAVSNAGIEATLLNLTVKEPGAQVTSPVDGAIVRWRLLDATGTWKLRVLRPLGGTTYLGAGTSVAAMPASLGTEVFTTDLPVHAGDTIGLDATKGAKIGIASGGMFAGWAPQLAEGESRSYTSPQPTELAFNADVQPRPTVTSVGPASGSFKGATAVTVTGTDFAGVSSVSFGGVPAAGLTVNSEGSLTAIAPASTPGQVVDVTVTTVAGTSPASAADRFEYLACLVPKLSGVKLKAAKKKLRKAHCGVGRVRRLEGATAKTGRVVKQGPKAGRTLAPDTRVNLTLR